MGKINQLDKHVAELIAAGEVVERPSSVVKELVENSIDAGASTVTVEIRNGGTTYLRVTDNGSGILREDVPVAFLRHATSKVAKQSDLDAIATLGFRGEALASISAVSRVELLTRTKEELAGTRYVIEGGDEIVCEDVGCPEGTTIIVRDIFYNTPARMKFLKKDQTEANSIAGVLDKMALSHPEVSFRFLRDGKEQLHTPGDGKLKSAVYAVFGKEFTQGLLPVEYSLGGVQVRGYVSKPTASRPNRSMQHFFINGRYVKSRTAMVALEEGCKGSIMVGKYPACVLHLQISCEAVDVNVHPAKLEVRFINERPIFDAVYHAVKTALCAEDFPKAVQLPKQVPPLQTAVQIPPTILPNKPLFSHEEVPQQEKLAPWRQEPLSREETVEITRPVIAYPSTADHGPDDIRQDYRRKVNIDIEYEEPASPGIRFLHDSGVEKHDIPTSSPKETVSGPEEVRPLPELRCSGKEFLRDISQRELAVETNDVFPAEKQEETKALRDPGKVLGEAFHTYLIVERGEELVMIDKHAAHERMLYEKLKRENAEAFSQMLLEPIPVTLSKEEYAAVLESEELLEKAGFEIEDFGAGAVLVRSAPLSLDKSDISSAVMEIAGYLVNSKTDVTTERLDWLYHNIACRAAIKAGDITSPEELAALAARLEQEPDIRYCPHGRPVSIVLKKRDLEKQFGRIQ